MRTETISQVATFQERPYQRETIEAVLQAQHKKRALVVLPTGTGKTVCFSKIIHTLNVPTLVLAHRKELLTQARNKLLHYYKPSEVGIIGGGVEEWDRPILVASVQTVRNRLPLLQAKGIRLVICDEAHHATKKNSYAKIFDALPGAYLVGFTATPERLDGASIADIFGLPVYERDIVSMVREGWLCDLRGILVRSTTSLDNLSKHLGDYNEKQLAELLNHNDRNRLIVQAYLTYAKDLQAICFAVDVAHAHALASAFNDCGIPSVALDGKTAQEKRDWILEQFGQGHIKVLINCEILTEGFDAPHVQCVIMARPTMSRSLFLQMIGRGTRLFEGKQECIILDITDNCTKHRLTPRSFKTVLGVQSSKQNVSLLEHDEDERIRREEEQRRAEERRLEQERARLEQERMQAEAIKRMKEIAEGKKRAEEERKQRAIQEQKNICFTEISLLGRAAQWERTEDVIRIRAAYATISIEPNEMADYLYDVWVETKYEVRCRAEGVTLSEAKEEAEAEARQVAAKIAARHGYLATEKQLETLRKFKIAIPDGCTRAQASNLIAARIAQLPARRVGA